MKDILHDIETLGDNDNYSYISSSISPIRLPRENECGRHIHKTPSLDDYDNRGIDKDFDFN